MVVVRRVLLTIAAVGCALAFPAGGAWASERATVTANVNLRAGPSSRYQSLGVVPAGEMVAVYSCRTGFDWCNVEHRGKRGYLAGRYLAYASQGDYYGELFSSVGLYAGVPLFWDDYPIYGPPGDRPPGNRPPGWRPPGDRPPNWGPPGQRPPGVRPPVNHPSHPIYRPPSFDRPSVGGGGLSGGFGGGRAGFGGGGRGGGRR